MAHMHPNFPDPMLIGQFRTFGPFGPAYQVLDSVKQDAKGEWLLRVQILETGEETEYPYAQAANDPEAH
jgi:hypothetical protein